MSDTNQVALSYVKEVTPGTTPATPVMRRMRFNGAGDLAVTPETVVSEEIAPGRQIQDTFVVGISAGGSVDFEAVYFDHDDIVSGALYSTWTEQNKRTKLTDTLAVAGGIFTFSAGTTFKNKDIVFARGFTNAANNGTKTLTAGTTTSATVAGLTNETPPSEAELRVIGFAGALGDFALTTTGFANLTSGVFNFVTGGQFAVGTWVRVKGFVATDANGWYRISAVASGQLTFDAADHTPAADTGAASSVKLFFGDYIKNGSTEVSFTLEEAFNDHSPVTYQYLTGMHVNAMALEMKAKTIVGGKFEFQGFNGFYTETRIAGATDLPPLLSTAYNTTSNVGSLRSGGAAVTSPNFVLEASIEIDNSLRFRDAVAVLGAAGVGSGEFSVTGKLNTYFGNKALAEKVIAGTETSFDIRLQDIDGSAVLYDLPRIKFTKGAPSVSKKNEDTVVDLEYQALGRKGVTSSYTILINRYWRADA